MGDCKASGRGRLSSYVHMTTRQTLSKIFTFWLVRLPEQVPACYNTDKTCERHYLNSAIGRLLEHALYGQNVNIWKQFFFYSVTVR